MHVREVSLLIISLILVVHAEGVGNCSYSKLQTIKRDAVEFEVRGTIVTAYVVKQGVRQEHNYFEWSFDKITERLKTPRLDPDLQNDFEGWTCMNPRIPRERLLDIIYGGVYLDPLEPLVPNTTCTGFRPHGVPQNTECGAVVQGFSPTELDCWSEIEQDSLQDISRERILIHYSHPSYPNFSLVSSMELLDGDLNYTRKHNGGEQIIEYKKNHMKISYEIFDFPWGNLDPVDHVETTWTQRSFNNASWVSLWWNMTVAFDKESSFANQNTAEKLMVRTKSKDGEFEISLDLLKTFLLDGEYTVDMDPLLRSFEFETIPAGTVKWNFALELCHRNIGRWDTMWYDPSFSALFVGDFQNVNPSESKKTAIAVGVSVSVVVVLVVILIILGIKVPAIRNAIRPFLKRNQPKERNPTGSKEGWVRSTTPDMN